MEDSFEKYISYPDRLIRDLFKNRDDAIAFFHAYLPDNVVQILELEQLEYGPDSYIDPKLSEHRTDLLFNVPTTDGYPVRISILFEHKSEISIDVFPQILRYLSRIYESSIRNNEFIPVLPFVFYHSNEKWIPVKSFKELFPLEGNIEFLTRYIPDFSMESFHLKTDDVEKVYHHLHLYAFLKTLQHIERKDISKFLIEIFEQAREVFQGEKGVAEFAKLLIYLLKREEISIDEARKSAQIIGTRAEEVVMNTADRLMQQGIERGIEQGIERGIEQGIERASLENAQRMLEKGYPLKEVMEITGLTEKNLQEHGLIENR